MIQQRLNLVPLESPELTIWPVRPSQFCFAVRRSEQHGPEGTVSIEEETFGDAGSLMHTPIVTLENHGSTPTAAGRWTSLCFGPVLEGQEFGAGGWIRA